MKNGFLTLKRKFKTLTASKVILIVLLVFIALLTPPSIMLAFNGISEPLTELVRGTFVLASVAVGFYYWKAKAENMHKYKQDSNITMNGE